MIEENKELSENIPNEEDFLDINQESDKSYNVKYDSPDLKDSFIDASGNVIDKSNLSPFEAIKLIAQQTNTKIKDPDPSCRKCYGRGYEGIETSTRTPIPCRCIYYPSSEADKLQEALYDSNKISSRLNRAQKRKMKKQLMKELKRKNKHHNSFNNKTSIIDNEKVDKNVQ